jgi:opacity protein-like surface antigen
MKNIRHLLLAVLITATSVYAAPTTIPLPITSIPTPLTAPSHRIDLFVTAGPAFASAITGGTIHGAGGTSIDFHSNTGTSVNPLYSVAALYTFEHVQNKPIDLSIGADVMYASFNNIHGSQVEKFHNETVGSAPYGYNASSTAVFAEGRLTYVKHPAWQPYGVLGIGLSQNRCDNMNNFLGIHNDGLSLSDAPPPNPHLLPSGTRSSFAYEVGAGVAHPLNKAVAVTAEYRYVNFGRTVFSGQNTLFQTTGNVSTSLGANTILFSLRFSFS